MNFSKIFFILSLIFFISSCGAVKKGFSNQKKNNSDEFLVEKKAPLVMPPNFNELPIPQSGENQSNFKESDFKKLIVEENNKSDSNSKNIKNKNFETSIIEKIKKD
tara:strand:- start:328 stop:645 length:318 start_codon:yes stop_codon:yes gene_type:complete